MIITRAPVRISFLGGGTDYPDYFRLHTGQTLGVAIDKYSYVTVKRLARLFDHSIRVGYSRTELVGCVGEIEHPAVREALRFLGIDGGIEINYVGDLPARTGLGSSSSFTVALLHALHAFKGELVSQSQLAEEAVHLEQELMHERVGVQDQYTCAHGGLLHLRFGRDGAVTVGRLPLGTERLAEMHAHMLLLYTGIQRKAHEILDEQLDRTRQGALERPLGRISELAAQGVALLGGGGPIAGMGELLHEGWLVKKQLSSKISLPQIDGCYDRARRAGALGGKLLGAGGGGFLLLFAAPERHAAIVAALPELPHVPFGMDYTGSSIVFYQPR